MTRPAQAPLRLDAAALADARRAAGLTDDRQLAEALEVDVAEVQAVLAGKVPGSVTRRWWAHVLHVEVGQLWR